MANNKRRSGGWGYSPSLTGPGTVFTLSFIALAIGMGVLLSRGVAPSSTLTVPDDKDVEVEVIQETPIPGQKGLQLKTIRFKECASTVTIDLLLDRSGSMDKLTPSGEKKIARLREAVKFFLEKANDTSVIGIQSFSMPDLSTTPSITNDIPVSYYKDVKTLIAPTLDSYVARGATPTHDALNFSLGILKEAIPKYPDRKFNFIFISDGAPCPGIDCPTQTGADQDPRKYTPNPADEIKKLGVNVYTLGIYEAGQANLDFLEDLLKSIASSPSHYYGASSADDVKKLLGQISNKICAEEAAAAAIRE